jgi:flagellar hook-length control protein FliK
MSAIISLPPGQSASASKFALDGGGDPDLAAGLGPFAALFRNLLDRQAAGGADSELLLEITMTEATSATPTTEDLDALLPFLDAMGLTREEAPLESEASTPTTTASGDIPLDPLAAAIAPPPGTADAAEDADMAAISAATENTGARHRATPAVSTETVARQATDAMPAIDVRAAPTKDASAGREFSSQLVAAVESVKEQASNTPGGIATAVHQAMATAGQHNAHAARALPVEQPVGARGWSEEVGNRVAWMATRMESRAELVLTPPQMGRVEVSLTVNGDQASANFVSANPAVREALEAALPRLREVLAESGIQLGQAQVGAENARQSAQQDKNGDNFGFDRSTGSTAGAPTGGTDAAELAGLKTGRGLVDVFA